MSDSEEPDLESTANCSGTAISASKDSMDVDSGRSSSHCPKRAQSTPLKDVVRKISFSSMGGGPVVCPNCHMEVRLCPDLEARHCYCSLKKAHDQCLNQARILEAHLNRLDNERFLEKSIKEALPEDTQTEEHDTKERPEDARLRPRSGLSKRNSLRRSLRKSMKSVGQQLMRTKSMRNRRLAQGTASESPFFGDLNYDMTHKDRGLHIIFSQENFDPATGQENRTGTDSDIRELKKAFGVDRLGFHTMIYRDSRAEEIRQVLRQVSGHDHSDYDCFAITVLSHGDETSFWAKDDRVDNRELWKLFTNDKCPSLSGKPKILINNTCQGLKRCPPPSPQELLKLTSQPSSPSLMDQDQEDLRENRTENINDGGKFQNIGQAQNQPQFEDMTSLVDFLLVFSTRYGDVSYRHETHGSFFIQALCKAIIAKYDGGSMDRNSWRNVAKEHGAMDNLDFTNVLTEATRLTIEDMIAIQKQGRGGNEERIRFYQMPNYVSYLTKKLVFSGTSKNEEDQGCLP